MVMRKHVKSSSRICSTKSDEVADGHSREAGSDVIVVLQEVVVVGLVYGDECKGEDRGDILSVLLYK
jgi:hypothetical protein